MVTFARGGSFIGTMIDDLCTKELLEPYRVLTSRSEYRLSLRGDNADSRLTPMGREIGMVDDAHWERFQEKSARINAEQERLKNTRIGENDRRLQDLLSLCDVVPKESSTLSELLRQPVVTYKHLEDVGLGGTLENAFERERVQTEVKYAGYIKRQSEEISKTAKSHSLKLNAELDYNSVSGLRLEAREKLRKFKPETIGEALEIGGVNPADVTALMVHLQKEARRAKAHQRASLSGSGTITQMQGGLSS